ncbi:MAG: type I-C CRISPR-associated protein Cas5 [Boseongicola sp. SB0677_bin_26]|nr:type I-C CRISPR-associated protein Cas5 [Boseongicola sp. SB0677_bin_26]
MTGDTLRLHVWGPYGLFTRPEMKTERVSYDVLTPSAARGILEAIHWRPAIRWVVDRIHVLRPIRFETLLRNEVGSVLPMRSAQAAMRKDATDELHMLVEDVRQQRSATLLRDVGYVIEAHVTLTGRAPSDTVSKHKHMFQRRAERGQYYHHPYLGAREFAADFELLDGAVPSELPDDQRDQDLGWMLHDLDYSASPPTPRFFRAEMHDGVIEVPPLDSEEVRA